MTLYDFLLLDEPCQTEAVWQGEFVTFREAKEATVMLYRVHNFYVEVYYNKSDNNISRCNPFRSRARLGLYLQASLN